MNGAVTKGIALTRENGRSVGALWRSLRVRLAVLGFLAAYVPVLLLFGVVIVSEVDVTVQVEDGVDVENTATERSSWVTWAVVVLAPAAAGAAWWWSGRAVRPIERIRGLAEEIEETDLSRRIEIGQGPTEIVSLAASFDAMLDRLERAAKTQAQLIEETSHELRIPLSVLTTNADVLLTHPEPTVETYREGLERSKRAAERLRTTVDELLVDARRRTRTIDRRPADLMAMVRGVADDAAVLATSRGVQCVVSGPSSLECSVDELTVRRAVANLVDNALRYAPSGSAIEVAVEATEVEASVVVTDHGPGIPNDEQERIFQRFWRGRDDATGTGLGLPISYQIAAAHGGSLTVTSPGPSGDGCVFRLTLPR